MVGTPRRLSLAAALIAALSFQGGCATFGGQSCDETTDTCAQMCGATVACVILAPCVIAAGVGFLAGGCTRCGEGSDPVGTGDDSAAASTSELPAPARMANAEMRY